MSVLFTLAEEALFAALLVELLADCWAAFALEEFEAEFADFAALLEELTFELLKLFDADCDALFEALASLADALRLAFEELAELAALDALLDAPWLAEALLLAELFAAWLADCELLAAEASVAPALRLPEFAWFAEAL